ncbi:unnamed protein product [Trichobilharzia regenti]|nr:unnamed protein product [Trichobilharzia regenti]
MRKTPALTDVVFLAVGVICFSDDFDWSFGSRQEQLRIPLSPPVQDTDAGSSVGSQASGIQRKSETGVFQTTSDEEAAAIPIQRMSVGGGSVGQPAAQLLASSGAMGTSGSLCGSSGTTTSIEGETTVSIYALFSYYSVVVCFSS